MPVVVTGSNPTPRSALSLSSEVARSVGKEGSATARSQAIDYLNHVISDLNTMQPWQMLRTVGSDTALTSGTADYTLSSDVYMMEKVQLVGASDAAVKRTVPYFDYAQYKDFDPTMSASSLSYYTVRNMFGDSKLTFYSAPSASDATTYKFRTSYIRRIPQLTASSTPDVPIEFENALLAGAKYYMRDMDEGADSPKAVREFANYQRLLRRLKFADTGQPDEHPRFRLGGGTSTFGTLYIAV